MKKFLQFVVWMLLASAAFAYTPGGIGYGGVLPSPTLVLNFLSGTLDPRITLTRASTATYFDATGTLQTAAINAPRFDYNPATLQPRGLLIEEGRTNTIRNSTMVGVTNGALPSPGVLPTNWFQGATTNQVLTILGTGVENGIAYIDFSIVASGVGQSRIQFESPAPTWPGSTPYALSAYVKLLSGSTAGFTSFNLEAFSLPSAVPTAVSLSGITNAGLATQRFVTTGVTGASDTSVRPEFFCISTGPASMTLRVGAPQLELAASATSYIPTTTVAVARAADIASMAFTPVYPSTLVGEAMVPALQPTVAEGIAVLTDGTVSNRIAIRANSAATSTMGGLFVVAGISNPVVATVNTITPGAVFKVGVLATATGITLSGNGGAAVTGAGSPPAGLNLLTFGQTSTPGNALNGWLRRVTYWPRALGPQELQAATQ